MKAPWRCRLTIHYTSGVVNRGYLTGGGFCKHEERAAEYSSAEEAKAAAAEWVKGCRYGVERVEVEPFQK